MRRTPAGNTDNRWTPRIPQDRVENEDSDLVRKAKAGDVDAFEALTNRYDRRVYQLAFRMLRHQQDAEDVTQETFLSALENLKRFREASGFRTWLIRIAANAALKIIRKRKRLETVSFDESATNDQEEGAIPHPEYIADWRQAPEEIVHGREIQRLLAAALERLDENHRVVFLLRDVEGLSVKETAEALGLTEGNTKVRLLRARLQLREDLTRHLGDPGRRIEPHRHD